VNKFFERFGSCGCALATVQVRQIDETLAWQGRQGYTRAAIRTYADSLKAFFRYAERRGWCAAGIAEAITAPRIYREEGLPSGPSWKDVRRLLKSVNTCNPKDIRDRAILILLATYGLRAGEVRQLRLDDIDWEHELISLRRPKLRLAVKYPLSRPVGEAILRYLREVRPRGKSRSLFLTLRPPRQAFSSGGLWAVVGHRVRRLGIVVAHPGPHCLRHACATHLLAQGLSLKQIGDHLGHRSTLATRIYAKVDLASLRAVADFDLGGLV
jgi:site-specific recombinase XerD